MEVLLWCDGGTKGKYPAAKVAEKLRSGIEQSKVITGKKPLRVTASFGVTTHRDERAILEMVIKADKAMCKAKQKGKNQTVIFSNG